MADDRSEAVHLWAHLQLGDDPSGDHTTLLAFSDVWRVAQTLELIPEAEDAPTWEHLQAALAKSRPDAGALVSTIDDELEVCPASLPLGIHVDLVSYASIPSPFRNTISSLAPTTNQPSNPPFASHTRPPAPIGAAHPTSP